MSGAGNVSVQINNVDDATELYNAFKAIVTGSEVQDGDLRINGDRLEKVNFGSSLRRRFSKASDLCNLTAGTTGDIQALKQKFINAFTAKVQSFHLEDKKLEQSLIDRLKSIVGSDGTPLSRRTVSLVVQMVEDKGDFAGRERTQTYNGVTWKMVGGPKGMRMSQKQFNAMFESAMELAVKDNAKYKLGLDAALKYYKDQFANTQNGADLERYFTGSLDLRTIADKMIAHLRDGLVPSMKGKARNNAMCPEVLSEGMCRKLAAVKEAEMLHGTAAINRKINIGPLTQRKHEQDTKVGVAKNFASEILLGTDMHELALCGLKDGERLGRFFLKNAPAFHRICDSVVAREAVIAANRKNPKAQKQVPAECDEIRALRLASPALADDFSKLIYQLAKSVLTLKPGMNDEDFSLRLVEKADAIYEAISGFTATVEGKQVKGFEQVIDARLAERMFAEPEENKNSLAERFYGELVRYFGQGTETSSAMLRALVLKAPPSTLRRMFAFSVRENGSKDLSGEDERFAYAGMIHGLGPLAKKLFQGMDLDTDKNADKYGIHSTLQSASGDNPDINPEIVRAIIYDTLQSRDIDFDSVQITCAAGAGSVAQTMMCKVYSGDDAPAEGGPNGDQAKDIIIKVFRPGVKEEFDAEVKTIRDALDDVDDDDSLKQAISDGLVPFESCIASEVNPKSELINALKGLQAYGQPREKNKDFVPVERQWNLGNGKTVKSESTISVGSERLILKKGIDLDKKLANDGETVGTQLMERIKGCRTDADFEAVLNEYFVCDNDATMLIETAKGQDISKAIQDFETRYNETWVALPKDEQGDERIPPPDDPTIKKALKNRDGLVKLSRSFAVLTEKFVNGALFAANPFVHGDLQAGNIRYNDEMDEIVLIDYGKAMTLKQGESDALKILFQLEGRKETPKDADVVLEAYLSLVDNEIARLDKDNSDPKRLEALTKTKSELTTERGKEGFRLACKGSSGVHNADKGNVFTALVGILQKRKFPVPKALVMFNDSYSRLSVTAGRIHAALKNYDELLDKSMRQFAASKNIETDLEFLSGVNSQFGTGVKDSLPLDYIGSIDCEVELLDEKTGRAKIKVKEADIPPNYDAEIKGKDSRQSASAILRDLSAKIFDGGVSLRDRRQAAKDAITLLQHEQSRLQEFKDQFGEDKLAETLKGYGIELENGEVEVAELGKCSKALKRIGAVIGNLQAFVGKLDASGFDYDDGVFQSTLLGDKGTKQKVDEKFGGSASDWRLPKPTASEVDYILAQYAKSVTPDSLEKAPEAVRKRFNELVVQSGLSWPKQLYLLSSKSLTSAVFDNLVKKLSSHGPYDQNNLDGLFYDAAYDDGGRHKIALGFDENVKLDGVRYEYADYVDANDYNALVELANDLGVTLPESIDTGFKQGQVTYNEYKSLLDAVLNGELPSPGKVLKCDYSKNQDLLDAKKRITASEVATIKFVNRQCEIKDLPDDFPLKDKYNEVVNAHFSQVREDLLPFKSNYSAETFCRVVFSRNKDVENVVKSLIDKYDEKLNPNYDEATRGRSEFIKVGDNEYDVKRNYVDYLYALNDAARQFYKGVGIPEDITAAIKRYEAYRDEMFSLEVSKDENQKIPLVSAKDCGFTDGTKNALDVYEEVLKEVNDEMPVGLKLVRPAKVTYADLDNLTNYKVPLEKEDRDEFNKMLAKLEDATPDYRARVEAYRSKDKITRGDFMRLASDLVRAFSEPSLASDAVGKRYHRVWDFIEKKLPFDPPSSPKGQITLAAYSDLLKTLRRHAECAFIKVPEGTKMHAVGEDSRKNKRYNDPVTIGECKRAYDQFFKPDIDEEGKEVSSRLQKLKNNPEGGNFPIDGTQEVKADDPELKALVDAAEKLGLPVPDHKLNAPVSIDEVKALYREVQKLEETQPKLNDISGIAGNLFRGNRPAPKQGEKAPAWDLSQRQDETETSVHFKTYAPIKFSELKFAGDSGFNLWSEGLGGRIKSGAKESYIAYEIGLDQKSIEELPDLKNRKERQRQVVVDKVLDYFRRNYAEDCLKDVKKDYAQEVQKTLQTAAKNARNKLFAVDAYNNYRYGDKLFEVLRKRINDNPDAFKFKTIDDNPDAFKFKTIDEKDPNLVMLLEAWLLLEEEDRK